MGLEPGTSCSLSVCRLNGRRSFQWMLQTLDSPCARCLFTLSGAKVNIGRSHGSLIVRLWSAHCPFKVHLWFILSAQSVCRKWALISLNFPESLRFQALGEPVANPISDMRLTRTVVHTHLSLQRSDRTPFITPRFCITDPMSVICSYGFNSFILEW